MKMSIAWVDQLPLAGKKIFITETKDTRYSAMAVEFFFFKIIRVSTKSKKYSKSALKGMFAHELSHFSIIDSMNLFQNLSYFWRLPFSKKVRADFERKADILAIKKGYANELIALKKEDAKGRTKKDLKQKYSRGYLSPEEIRQYSRKIKNL
jgi:hypothetical protein